MRKMVVLLVAGLALTWAIGAQDLQAYTVRGVVRLCDTGVVAKCGANIECQYCPFIATLRLTTSPYTLYNTTSTPCPGDADVVWTGIPAGTYRVSARSQIQDSGWYYTPPGCYFTITVTDHDLNYVDPKVRFSSTPPQGPMEP